MPMFGNTVIIVNVITIIVVDGAFDNAIAVAVVAAVMVVVKV